MGRILNTRQKHIAIYKDLIGIKSGFVLTEEQFIDLAEATHEDIEEARFVLGGAQKWWQGDQDEFVSIRIENLEANIIYVMYSIGAIPDRRTSMDILRDFIKKQGIDSRTNYWYFSEAVGVASTVLHITEFFPEMLPMPAIDPNIMSLIENFKNSPDYQEFHRRNFMNRNLPLQREWDGLLSLSELFKSEDKPINTIPEQYFDQRYIDYLYAQGSKIQNIQWRQFEYLTAEYFRRNGYEVEVGRGRGDGGKDVAARKREGVTGPDLVLIQCKRNASSNPVDIDTVKAFWTTINEDGATKGLIVTTSRLTSGAKTFCDAHRYRLTSADGETVRLWLKNLASHQAKAL
jgi:restriction system protein